MALSCIHNQGQKNPLKPTQMTNSIILSVITESSIFTCKQVRIYSNDGTHIRLRSIDKEGNDRTKFYGTDFIALIAVMPKTASYIQVVDGFPELVVYPFDIINR